MRILVTPTFDRTAKKLHRPQKAALDEAVRTIANQPDLGEVLMVGPHENFYRDPTRLDH